MTNSYSCKGCSEREREIMDGFDAIFAYVPEAEENDKELSLADKINILGRMYEHAVQCMDRGCLECNRESKKWRG